MEWVVGDPVYVPVVSVPLFFHELVPATFLFLLYQLFERFGLCLSLVRAYSPGSGYVPEGLAEFVVPPFLAGFGCLFPDSVLGGKGD